MSEPANNSGGTISGIEVMRGVGAKPSKPFWADAWERVLHRWGARIGIGWIAVVAFFAVFAPLLANGLPAWTVHYELLEDGVEARCSVVVADVEGPHARRRRPGRHRPRGAG